MTIEIYLSFIVAALILCFTPGPTVFFVIGQALRHGNQSVLPLIAGTLCGDALAMSVSFAGLGAVLATSALLFNLLKWVGAIYLIYLGVKSWRAKLNETLENSQPQEEGSIFRQAVLVTALNPKGIIFFIAFFPLFINAEGELVTQMLMLAFTMFVISALSVLSYCLSCGFIKSRLNSKLFLRRFNRFSGAMLVSAGVLTAAMQK